MPFPLLLPLIGAGIGALTNKDDPLKGGLIGGAAGFVPGILGAGAGGAAAGAGSAISSTAGTAGSGIAGAGTGLTGALSGAGVPITTSIGEAGVGANLGSGLNSQILQAGNVITPEAAASAGIQPVGEAGFAEQLIQPTGEGGFAGINDALQEPNLFEQAATNFKSNITDKKKLAKTGAQLLTPEEQQQQAPQVAPVQQQARPFQAIQTNRFQRTPKARRSSRSSRRFT